MVLDYNEHYGPQQCKGPDPDEDFMSPTGQKDSFQACAVQKNKGYFVSRAMYSTCCPWLSLESLAQPSSVLPASECTGAACGNATSVFTKLHAQQLAQGLHVHELCGSCQVLVELTVAADTLKAVAAASASLANSTS